MNSYQDAIDYLYQFIAGERALPRPDPNLNLLRTRALLTAIGDPQRTFPAVVVAGTKGKGSTAAMLESIYRTAGLRTGLWTSPHLHSYRERIQVDRLPISQDDLIDLTRQIQPHVAAVAHATGGPPVMFAIGFALAMQHFATQHIDIAILEVGLGGRYDSAAVIDEPLLAVITPISYDHLEILGTHLSDIAWQKAGIIKPGCTAITSAQQPEVLAVLLQEAQAQQARLYSVVPAAGVDPIDVVAEFGKQCYTNLPGTFQRENAQLAVAAALILRDGDFPIEDWAITEGLAKTEWPARFEIVPGTPPVVIDGAHNGDSAARLVESLAEVYPARRLVLVFGASRDKLLDQMLVHLGAAADALVLTRAQHPRAWDDLDALAELAAPHLRPATPVVQHRELPTALAVARALAGRDGVVCVTGSLFVAAEARVALGLTRPGEVD